MWTQVLEVIRQMSLDQWDIHNVHSHVDLAVTEDVLMEWWAGGNDKADSAAARAFDSCPTAFWQNYIRLCTHHDQQTKLVKMQLDFLLDVAQHELSHRADAPLDAEDLPVSSLRLQWIDNESDIVSQIPFDFESSDVLLPDKFPAQFLRNLVRFLADIDTVANRARYVTGLELMFGFRHFYGDTIPFQRSRNGQTYFEDVSNIHAGGLIRHTMATALRIFLMALEHVSLVFDIQFVTSSSNRPDVGLNVCQWSLLVGWPEEVDSVVAALVRDTFSGRPHRRACDLARPFV